MEFAQLLVRYEELHRRAGFTGIGFLRPGVAWPYRSWDEVDERPPDPPEQVRELWAWHDGIDSDRATTWAEVDLSLGWELLTTDEAARRYAVQRSAARIAFEDPDECFPKSFLPIAKQGNGDLLSVDTATPTGELRAYRQSGFGLDDRTYADSLRSLIEFDIELLSTGRRTFVPDRGFVSDPQDLPEHLRGWMG